MKQEGKTLSKKKKHKQTQANNKKKSQQKSSNKEKIVVCVGTSQVRWLVYHRSDKKSIRSYMPHASTDWDLMVPSEEKQYKHLEPYSQLSKANQI